MILSIGRQLALPFKAIIMCRRSKQVHIPRCRCALAGCVWLPSISTKTHICTCTFYAWKSRQVKVCLVSDSSVDYQLSIPYSIKPLTQESGAQKEFISFSCLSQERGLYFPMAGNPPSYNLSIPSDMSNNFTHLKKFSLKIIMVIITDKGKTIPHIRL